MTKGFHIDNYYDGYRTSEINCVDLPIAAAAGHFDRDNYFYYCFCYIYVLNWMRYFRDDWLEIRKCILDMLDLEFCAVRVNENQELFDQLIRCMDQGTPVIFLVKYGSLFYSKYYKYGTYDHGIIINDYNDETNVFGIRDREVVREHIEAGIFTSDVMHRLAISDEQLKTIWISSNQLFEQEKSPHFNVFYCIRPKAGRKEISFPAILKRLFCDNTGSAENQFEKYLNESTANYYNKVKVEKFEAEKIRRIYYRSYFIFLQVIDRYFDTEVKTRCEYAALIQTVKDFMKLRLETINWIQVFALKNMLVNPKDIRCKMEQDNLYFLIIKDLISKLLNV